MWKPGTRSRKWGSKLKPEVALATIFDSQWAKSGQKYPLSVSVGHKQCHQRNVTVGIPFQVSVVEPEVDIPTPEVVMKVQQMAGHARRYISTRNIVRIDSILRPWFCINRPALPHTGVGSEMEVPQSFGMHLELANWVFWQTKRGASKIVRTSARRRTLLK